MSSGTANSIAGRYRLLRRLGQGGMGVVWHARDEFLHRDVAIKEIHRLAAPDEVDTFRRTWREARAAAALKHPDIVTVHDIVEHDGRPWIVMELVTGRSLADHVQEDGPLPEHRVAEIGLRVLGALDVAHRNGILHRDVKPANILLSGDRVVLTDFGIAAMAGTTVLTGTNQLIGSPEYIAPERIAGDRATPAADLWALGVTLYVAVSGRSPFRRAGLRESLAAALTHEPDPLPEAARLGPVVLGLLAKNPDERLTARRAGELLSAPAADATQPVATVASTLASTMPHVPASRRSRSVAGLRGPALVIGALVLAVLGWLTVFRSDTTGRSDPATSQPSTDANRSAPSSPAPPPVPPGYKLYQEYRGYSITVPHSWDRPSVHGPSDYQVAGTFLFLYIDRHRDWPGATAYPYLEQYDQSGGSRPGNATDYQRIRLDTLPAPAAGGTAAEMEYTYRYRNPDSTRTYWHELVRVVITESGHVYVIECSVLANDPNLVEAEWQAVGPTMNTILQSFRATP